MAGAVGDSGFIYCAPVVELRGQGFLRHLAFVFAQQSPSRKAAADAIESPKISPEPVIESAEKTNIKRNPLAESVGADDPPFSLL
jgi:hypothetical protein